MNQPIAGVSPSTLKEVTVMTVWPSLAATKGGRWWGRRYLNKVGITLFGIPVTVGRITALLSVPFILPPYFLMLLPFTCRRYRLTNKRVVVERGMRGGEEKAVSLDRFDSIEVVVLPGQAWYPAGELIFKLGNVETFRLSGVPRPETFRQVCLKAHMSYVGVQKARQQGVAV